MKDLRILTIQDISCVGTVLAHCGAADSLGLRL